MNQKFWQLKPFRLLLCLFWLAWAIGGSTPASVGAWQSPKITIPPVPSQPEAVETFNFTAIAAGGDHTCALLSDGRVKCWGFNGFGQLGDGTTTSRSTPVNVLGLVSGVTAITVGESHTCALVSGGGVKCWGANGYGQLGDGTTTQRNTPVDVAGLASGVTAITAGESHTCALVSGGGVKCWGTGPLGDGTTTNSSIPVDVAGLSNGVTAIAAGGSHTCVLLSGGGVKCWGENQFGQLGDGTTTYSGTPADVISLASGVIAIAAGQLHTCALLSSGGVKCWGWNYLGQLGDSTTTDRNIAVDVSGIASGMMAITAGEWYTCALTSGGGVKCWGSNFSGQLGDGTIINRSTPVNVVRLASSAIAIAAGSGHTCALLSGGGVKCWGWNYYGQLGDGTLRQRSIPVDVTGLAGGVTTIAAGQLHTCVLLSGGGVKCWGYNGLGQLGDGTTMDRGKPVDVVRLASGVMTIAGGGAHTCVLLSDGGVKCFGYNGDGQLGDSTIKNSSTPVDVVGLASGVASIAAGGVHTCALLLGGGVKCWGGNRDGQLGNGMAPWDSSTPVDVVGLASGVTAIAAGGGNTCALLSGGGVKCWGDNSNGQLGDSTRTQRSIPVDVIGLPSSVTSIAVGGDHTCALVSGGGVKCWGYNGQGQLGDSTTTDRSTPVDVIGLTSGGTVITAGLGYSCVLATDGRVKCWGYNSAGELGNGTTTNSSIPADVSGLASGATAIAAGEACTCALVGAGRPKCWGINWEGQLGIGIDPGRQLTPVVVSSGQKLTINYPNGQPGSFFTITGWNFTPSAQATLSINGQVITTTLEVNPTGSFIFFLNTSGAEPGGYVVTVSGNPGATTSFRLANEYPLRTQEGGGLLFIVPHEIAYQNFVYLPVVGR